MFVANRFGQGAPSQASLKMYLHERSESTARASGGERVHFLTQDERRLAGGQATLVEPCEDGLDLHGRHPGVPSRRGE